MRLADHMEIVAALPYLAAGIGLVWLGMTLALRRAAHARLKRRLRREKAERRAGGPTPWNDWLRAINEQSQRDRIDTAQDRPRGKWRE